MTEKQYLKNLSVPEGKIDAVLDTDTFNEVDDQVALAYMLRSAEKINLRAIYAAPFLNDNSESPEDGMEKSYDEIMKLLDLAKCADMKKNVFEGSRAYLKAKNEAVISPAALDLATRAMEYSTEKPLYVVAIAAVTNIASALLLNPEISKRIVIVWLGGNAYHYKDTAEFNMYQDVDAVRVVFESGAPLVQLPCMGVVSGFYISKPELEFWLKGKNELCSYIADSIIAAAERCNKNKPWSRIIWDVTAVAWLMNNGDRFMLSRLESIPQVSNDIKYIFTETSRKLMYVYHIQRDAIMKDMIEKLTR